MVLLLLVFVQAQDCKPGYSWERMSGVGCVQDDCNSITNAHYSYTKDCICGSVGSINEDINDANKACHRKWEYKSCPGCLYACIHADELCPGEDFTVIVKDFEGSDDNRVDDNLYDEDVDENWWDKFDIPYEDNLIAQLGDDGPTFLDKINDKIARAIGDVEYKDCMDYDNKGMVDCVIPWSQDDYDDNGCSPQEKINSEVDSKTKEIFTMCKCKEGYKRVEGGCKFAPPIGLKLDKEEILNLMNMKLLKYQ